jgi:outer membrane protein OmpA-like peptidoglycan-associated protein
MKRSIRNSLVLLAAFCLAVARLRADVQLSAVQFPERSSVKLRFISTNRAAPAEAEASVKFKEGQARIEIEYEHLPPAILFGGDITSYVVWAVARDGNSENLGELIVGGPKGSSEYRTGQKEFALMITAEPYPMVLAPSDLVIFTSAAPPVKKARSTPITLATLLPGARRGNEQIGSMSYRGADPLDLVQARSVLAQAEQIGAERENPDAVRDARIALAQATNLFGAGKTREGIDYARRSVSLSSTAIRDTQRRMNERAAADAAARRAAEMQSLEQQRTSAQQQAASAQAQALDAREQAMAAREALSRAQQQLSDARQQAAAAQQDLNALQQQAQQAQSDAAAAQQRAAAAGLSAEASETARREADESRRRAETLAEQAQTARAEAERTSSAAAEAAAALESQKRQLEARVGETESQKRQLEARVGETESQKRQLETRVGETESQKRQLETRVGETEAENARLRKEREDLTGQVRAALSSVAQITQTARGVVVNLPDILFDTNKATLKQNAQVAMGKLAGIVSVFPNINLRIEGHTDSTGTDAINDRLSRERAASVMAFLKAQGVAAARLSAEGYGSKIPVADNGTVEGRARNRRVEIILAEGVIQGAGD